MKQKLLGFIQPTTLFLSSFLMVGFALADTSAAPNALSSVTSPGGLDKAIFCPIVDWMFWILISVSVIMVIYAAYNYLVAGDDTEKVHRATKIITYAAIAVAVAVIAKGFPSLIGSIFNANGTTSFELTC
jgi:hypothetical protein